MIKRTIRLASRKSPLAQFQAQRVAGALEALDGIDRVEIVGISSHGDDVADAPIKSFIERGVFTAAVDHAVATGVADVAVHSAKDLPTISTSEGVILAAVPFRGEVRDCLVGRSLDDLSPGAMIATGSTRRRAQLAFVRPDLGFIDLRGNIATRVDRVPTNGAAVVALVALERLGLNAAVAEVLSTTVMLPQVGQGAIALQCRSDDEETLAFLAAIDNVRSHRAVRAERAYLRHFGTGCDLPLGAYATSGDDGAIDLEGMVASADGHVMIRRSHRGDDPEMTGSELARLLVLSDGAGAALGIDAA